MNEPVVFSYLAEKVIDDIRKDVLKPEIALAMTMYPFNDYVRERLEEQDLKYILNLLEDENTELKAFGLMISRPFQDREEIKKTILEIWNNEVNKSFLLGFGCIYRLLEYNDITSGFQDQFFGFIKDHWDQWKEKLVSCYPAPSRILDGARSRINNPDFPEWKKWIYLIEMACSPDVDNARDLLAAIDTVNSDFRTKVKNGPSLFYNDRGRAGI